MAEETPAKRKEREPITTVFAVILVIGCILAVGIHVNDNMLNKTDVTVTESSTVEVNYTVSLYNYYDQGGFISQTTLKSIDEKISSGDFKATPDYSLSDKVLSVDVDNFNGIQQFASSLVGHKVGDTIRIKVDAKDAYERPETPFVLQTDGTISKTLVVSSLDDLADIDKFGWTYTSYYDQTINAFVVSFTMNSETEAIESKLDDNVTVKTSGFTVDGDVIRYTMTVEKAVATGNTYTEDGVDYKGVQQFRLIDTEGNTVTAYAAETVNDDGTISGKILTKMTTQITNQDLYFEITIVSIK